MYSRKMGYLYWMLRVIRCGSNPGNISENPEASVEKLRKGAKHMMPCG